MTTLNAIEDVLGVEGYAKLRLKRKDHPEMLRMAALECFKFPTKHSFQSAATIRKALVVLDGTGIFMPHEFAGSA